MSCDRVDQGLSTCLRSLPTVASCHLQFPNRRAGLINKQQATSKQARTIMSYEAFEAMADEEPSLNIPSLLTLAVVSFFVIRWFLNRDGEPGSGGAAAGRSRARGHAVDPAQVDQILQMFPQFSAREITWDLQRNGGSVPATTERILSGRGLEVVSTFFFPLFICCVA